MVMTLTVEESGCVYFVKRPGAVLEPGCMVARLQLDDPSSIHPVSCSSFTLRLTLLSTVVMHTYIHSCWTVRLDSVFW